jgi:cytochrome c-type biogenesis protein CcmH
VIGFWPGAALLTLASLGVVLWPLLRRGHRPPPSRAEAALALYRQQLAALAREQDAGLIAAAEGERLASEIKRRMLAVTGNADAPAATVAAASEPARRLSVLLVIVVPLAAIGLYVNLGAPGAPDQPLAGRTPTVLAEIPPDERATAERAVRLLTVRLAEQPDDAGAWRLLARSLRLLGRGDDAVAAYRRAHAVAADDPGLAAEFGEALVALSAGRVDDEAQAAFTAALLRDPEEARAHYYLALRRAQDGDIEGALRGWLDLIARAPADAPWLQQVRRQADRARTALGEPPAR